MLNHEHILILSQQFLVLYNAQQAAEYRTFSNELLDYLNNIDN